MWETNSQHGSFLTEICMTSWMNQYSIYQNSITMPADDRYFKEVTETFKSTVLRVFQLVQNFCVIWFINFYLDIAKDRLYIF